MTGGASDFDPCCDMMKADLDRACDTHLDRADCPDALIYFDADTNRYGLYIHDGGSSFVEIRFCPWCGTNLGN